MIRRLLPAFAVWRPAVTITRVDLADGETLQVLGHGTARRVGRLTMSVDTPNDTIGEPPASAEVTGVHSRGHTAFHLWRRLLPGPIQIADEAAIDVSLRIGRRRARLLFSDDAFENRNSEVSRPVAPDLVHSVQRALRRLPHGAGLRVVSTPLSPRVALTSTHLDEVCQVGLQPGAGRHVAAAVWTDGAERVEARPSGDGRWEWPDLRLLAQPGRRWSLLAVLADGENHPVRLPHDDLRNPGTVRVFPTTRVDVAEEVVSLSLGLDGGHRVVLRCRSLTEDDER